MPTDTPTADQKFWLLFDHAAVGMAIVLPDGRFSRVNAAFCEFTGYPEEQLKELDFQSITHKDDLAQEVKLIAKLRKKQASSYTIDKRYIHNGGKVVWGRLSVSLERDRVGNPIEYLHVVQDISAGRQTESLAKLEALLHYSEHAVVLSDAAGTITAWNPAAERLYGYTASEATGMKLSAIAPVAEQNSEPDENRPSGEGERESRHEAEHLHKDGHVLPMLVASVPVPGERGSAPGTCMVAYPMPVEQPAIELPAPYVFPVGELLDALPLGVLVIDTEGRSHYANSLVQKLLGRAVSPDAGDDAASELHKACVEDSDLEYPPDRMPIVRALYGETSKVEDMEIRQRDRTVPVQVWGAPVFGASGQIEYAVSVYTDESEPKASRRALAVSQDRYQHICDKAADVISHHDVKGNYLFANRATERLLGYDTTKLVGTDALGLVHPDDLPTVTRIYKRYLAGADGAVRAIYRVLRKDGEYLWVETHARPVAGTYGLKREIVCVTRSIDERPEMLASLTEISKPGEVSGAMIADWESRDELTGVQNRKAADDLLSSKLSSRRQSTYPVGLLLVDIDGMAAINEEFGSGAGDFVLKKVARLITSSCRTEDFIARLEGDSFLVVLSHTDAAGTVIVGEKLIANVRTAYWADTPVAAPVTISIGGVCLTRHSNWSLDELLAALEAQLREAKELGRNRMVMTARHEAAVTQWVEART